MSTANARLRAKHKLITTPEVFEHRDLRGKTFDSPIPGTVRVPLEFDERGIRKVRFTRDVFGSSAMSATVNRRVYVFRIYHKPYDQRRMNDIKRSIRSDWAIEIGRALTREELLEYAFDMIGMPIMTNHLAAAFPDPNGNFSRPVGKVTHIFQTKDGTTDCGVRFYDNASGRIAAAMVESGHLRGTSIQFRRMNGIPIFRELSICDESRRSGTGFFQMYDYLEPHPIHIDTQCYRHPEVEELQQTQRHVPIEKIRVSTDFSEFNLFDPMLNVISVNNNNNSITSENVPYTSADEYLAVEFPQNTPIDFSNVDLYMEKQQPSSQLHHDTYVNTQQQAQQSHLQTMDGEKKLQNEEKKILDENSINKNYTSSSSPSSSSLFYSFANDLAKSFDFSINDKNSLSCTDLNQLFAAAQENILTFEKKTRTSSFSPIHNMSSPANVADGNVSVDGSSANAGAAATPVSSNDASMATTEQSSSNQAADAVMDNNTGESAANSADAQKKNDANVDTGAMSDAHNDSEAKKTAAAYQHAIDTFIEMHPHAGNVDRNVLLKHFITRVNDRTAKKQAAAATGAAEGTSTTSMTDAAAASPPPATASTPAAASSPAAAAAPSSPAAAAAASSPAAEAAASSPAAPENVSKQADDVIPDELDVDYSDPLAAAQNLSEKNHEILQEMINTIKNGKGYDDVFTSIMPMIQRLAHVDKHINRTTDLMNKHVDALKNELSVAKKTAIERTEDSDVTMTTFLEKLHKIIDFADDSSDGKTRSNNMLDQLRQQAKGSGRPMSDLTLRDLQKNTQWDHAISVASKTVDNFNAIEQYRKRMASNEATAQSNPDGLTIEQLTGKDETFDLDSSNTNNHSNNTIDTETLAMFSNAVSVNSAGATRAPVASPSSSSNASHVEYMRRLSMYKNFFSSSQMDVKKAETGSLGAYRNNLAAPHKRSHQDMMIDNTVSVNSATKRHQSSSPAIAAQSTSLPMQDEQRSGASTNTERERIRLAAERAQKVMSYGFLSGHEPVKKKETINHDLEPNGYLQRFVNSGRHASPDETSDV